MEIFIPDLIASKLFSNPEIEQVESAYSFSFDDGKLAYFDNWYYLEFVSAVLREVSRALQVGGQIIIFEPAIGLLVRKIYQMFHHELLNFRSEKC